MIRFSRDQILRNPELMGLLTLSSSVAVALGYLRADPPDYFMLGFMAIIATMSLLLIIVGHVAKKRTKKQENVVKKPQEQQRHRLIGEPRGTRQRVALPKLCQSLIRIIEQNSSVVNRSKDVSTDDLRALLQDVLDDTLRVYVFGHQSAGKSTLINALLKEEVSPVSSRQMTMCLIRIKKGERVSIKAIWNEKNVEEKISSIASLKKKMQNEWVSLDDQPTQIVYEMANNVLGIPKIELVDTPGVGSIWNDIHRDNLLDETVKRKVSTAAIAILVYKHGQTDMQPHGSLLQSLRQRRVKVLGVCNVTLDFQSAFNDDKEDALETVGKAESHLRSVPESECFRVLVKPHQSFIASMEGKSFADEIDAKTIDGFRTIVKSKLKERELHLELQAVKYGAAIVDKLINAANDVCRQYRPKYESLIKRRTNLRSATAAMHDAISDGYDDQKVATQTTLTGSAAAGLVGAAIVYALGTVSTGGLLLLPGAGLVAGGVAGNIIGSNIDSSKLKDFERKLSQRWERVRKVIETEKTAKEKVLSPAILSKVDNYSNQLFKHQKSLDLFMDELELDFESNLKKRDGYEVYRKSEVLLEESRNIKQEFDRYLSPY